MIMLELNFHATKKRINNSSHVALATNMAQVNLIGEKELRINHPHSGYSYGGHTILMWLG